MDVAVNPNSRFRKLWDISQILALFYVALLVPVRTGFGIELCPGTGGWWIELMTGMGTSSHTALTCATRIGGAVWALASCSLSTVSCMLVFCAVQICTSSST